MKVFALLSVLLLNLFLLLLVLLGKQVERFFPIREWVLYPSSQNL